MTLKLRNTTMGDVEMDMSNLLNILELKNRYVKLLDEKELTKGDVESSQLRMFAMGKELKDDLFIYSYDILNESTI